MEEISGIDIANVRNLDVKILHRNWKRAFSETFVLMSTAMVGEVICLVGPTRAGKSKLLEQLVNLMFGSHYNSGEDQPVVSIELVNDDTHAKFTFRSLIIQALEKIRHPIYSSHAENGRIKAEAISRIERARERTLNQSLVNALKLRNTRFLIIDEAQHIRYASKEAMAAVSVMDALKAMAKNANVVLIIAGTYPILEAINRSSHLEGRKYDVHLSRYHQTKEDIAEFQWILAHYDALLDLDESLPSLMNCTDILYQGSFGCIGLVRAWLYYCSVLAVSRNKKIDLPLITEAMKSPQQLYSIAEEILAGETILGIEPCRTLKSAVSLDLKSVKVSKKVKPTSKPFQRKAKRLEPKNRM